MNICVVALCNHAAAISILIGTAIGVCPSKPSYFFAPRPRLAQQQNRRIMVELSGDVLL